MIKKLAYFMLFCTMVVFAAGFDMHKTMKEMKRSFKCVSGKSSFLDKCGDDLQEIEKLKSNLAACKDASKVYYEVLFKDRMIPQIPNEMDVNKAFDEITEKVNTLKTAIETKNAALRTKTVGEIQELIKKAHAKYQPEM